MRRAARRTCPINEPAFIDRVEQPGWNVAIDLVGGFLPFEFQRVRVNLTGYDTAIAFAFCESLNRFEIKDPNAVPAIKEVGIKRVERRPY